MNQALQIRWLSKVALTALSALLFWAIISPIIAGPPRIQISENDGQAAPTLVAYRKEPTPRAVLVGTSLTYRLKEQYFLPLKIRNFAIPGRSPLDGLGILASYPKLPAEIFVETNVMVWKTDADFVSKFSYNSGPEFAMMLPPVRSLVAYFNSPPTEVVSPAAAIDENILNEPPTDHDNAIYLERGKKEWSGHSLDGAIKSNVEALAIIVKMIEDRGSRIHFLELPLAPGMADTDVAKTTRTALHLQFPDASRWLASVYPSDQLRFTDDAHLDERSALIVSRVIRRVIQPFIRMDLNL